LLASIDLLLDAGRAAGEIRADVTADDVAAGLIGIFTVARAPEYRSRASHLLDIFADGLRAPIVPAAPRR
jgi:transcriptional regulator SbtR-like protein